MNFAGMRTVAGMMTIAACAAAVAPAAENSGVSFGVNVMFGGRYDDLRMCVGSDAGVKGGPIADIMLDARFHVSDQTAVAVKLPVFRPILFALAFDMLQFEPEVWVEHRVDINEKVSFVLGPALGLSLHYGPDYETKKDAPDPESFFAAGPVVSCLLGLGWENKNGLLRIVGVRPFYTPLFSAQRDVGTVLGATLEGHLDFAQTR